MKRTMFLSFGILAALLFIQTNTFACGCPARSKDITEAVVKEFNESSFVFSGKVVEATWVPMTEKNVSGEKMKAEVLTLKFAVDNWWKGENNNQVIWRTSHIKYADLNFGMGGSNCEFSFNLGIKYLVYATNLNGKLVASVCSATTGIENAERDIKELQKLKETKKNFPK